MFGALYRWICQNPELRFNREGSQCTEKKLNLLMHQKKYDVAQFQHDAHTLALHCEESSSRPVIRHVQAQSYGAESVRASSIVMPTAVHSLIE